MAALGPGPLVVATHNRGKLAEMEALFAPLGVVLQSAAALGLPEPAETETTFVGNARIKAHDAARATGRVALADDSGLCVDALDGAPGVYSADWAEGTGGRDFHRAMRRVHAELLARQAPVPWRAQFRSTLVLAWPDGTDRVFEGVLDGQVVWPMRGAEGHGYDPVFLPDGHILTVAEMSAAKKNCISHRAQAFRRLIDACFT